MAKLKNALGPAVPPFFSFPATKIRIGQQIHVRLAFFMGAIVAGVLQGLALAVYGPFQDSQIYYDLFLDVGRSGLWSSLADYATQTGKFEPVATLIFWFESLFLGSSPEPFTFLLVNMVLLNLLVAQTVGRRLVPHGGPLRAFVTPILCLSSYLIFSKQLYFWRSVLSLCFFINAISSIGIRRLLWAVLAILSHYSAAAFLILYCTLQAMERTRRPVLFQGLVCGVVIVATVFAGNIPLLTFFVSGGDLDVFLAPAENGWQLFTAVFACLVVALLSQRRAAADASFRPLFVFSLVLLLVCLANFNNYHLMQRLSLPAFLITPFIPFAYRWRGLRLLAARWGIVLSVLPTLRLWDMLANGQFTPT